MKRKDQVASFGCYELEGPLEKAILYLSDISADSRYSDYTIDWDCGYEVGDGNFVVYAMRDETEKEAERRIAQAASKRERVAKEKEARVIAERAEYERLKKKYDLAETQKPDRIAKAE